MKTGSTYLSTRGRSVFTPRMNSSVVYADCMRKLFAKCFHKVPILTELMIYDVELATFCAVHSRHIGATTPYFSSESCANRPKDQLLYVNVRFPSSLDRPGVVESGVEVRTWSVSCTDTHREYCTYSVDEDGVIRRTEYEVLEGIDDLELEISLSNRPKH